MIRDLKKNIIISKYVFKFCPMYFLLSILYIALNTTFALAEVYLVKYIISFIINGALFKEILNVLLIYLIIMTISVVYKNIYDNYIVRIYNEIFINRMQNFLYSKVKNIDYADFDNPEFYDSYSRALRDGISRGITVYNNFVNLVSGFFNTIALGTFIIVSDVWLIFIVMISVIVNLFTNIKIDKEWHNLDLRTEKNRRMYFYVNRVFYQQKYAAEIKTTPISDLLIERFKEAGIGLNKEYMKTQKSIMSFSTIQGIISYIFENAGTYLYLGYKLFVLKSIGLDTFASVINSTSQFKRNFFRIADAINKIKTNALYVDDFLKFVNYKPSLETLGTDKINNAFEELNIANVNFSYPVNNYNSLSDFNLKITKGEKLAIVGLNGAGKTTLIKLLLKFYNPNTGYISFNEQNIINIKEDEIRKEYAIVFQDFQLYAVSIAENILMRKMKEEDEELVWECLKKVGLLEKVRSLKDGINTVVTKEFEKSGVSFSGGERQRLAIARVFASNASIYVLDEPTSALDPFAERDINKLIMESSISKTIIIIAHRLSTVVDASKIILIELGRIIESGNHNELLQKKGKYYEMFLSQASLYQRNN